MKKYKLNLKELSPDEATIQGTSLAIVDKNDSCVYLTSKVYIDKLFKLIGYKSLGVVKILEEYTDKSVSSAGNLDTHKIYIDNLTDSFVVTTPAAVEWVNAMLKFLSSKTFTVDSVKRYDTYYYWDQITVTNSFGSKFAIYVDLADEYVEVVALSYDKEGVLVGVSSEGRYEFSEGQSSFDSFKVAVSAPVDISSEFTTNQTLSIYEYVELLKFLGYVDKKKKNYYATDKSDDRFSNLEGLLDLYNEMSWLRRRVTETPLKTTFYDACCLITSNLEDKTFWSLTDFYSKNRREVSDMFVLKN